MATTADQWPGRDANMAVQLVAGHRRLEAARLLGWSEIAAIISDANDDGAYILTLVENLQREDLTADEEAAALGVLVRERKWSVRRVAESIGRDPMYVSRRLRVFEDPVLSKPVLQQRIPVSTAEVLLRALPEERAHLINEAVANGWGQLDARRAMSARRRVTLQSNEAVDAERSTPVVQLLRQARQALDAGPVSGLSAVARAELVTFSQQLSLLALQERP